MSTGTESLIDAHDRGVNDLRAHVVYPGPVMKALVYDRYGGPEVLEVREVPRPEPGSGEVVARVRAAALNRSDWENLVGSPFYARMAGGLLRPRRAILGSDFAGDVTAIGSGVTRFAVGERVFGDLMFSGASSFAEYVRFPESALVTKLPGDLTYVQASALPQAGTIALQGLEGAGPGSRVLIVGGGGATGLFAIQIAAAAGATVTATDTSAKLDIMRTLGASHAFDYRSNDLADSGQKFDLILDPIAGLSPTEALRLLAEGGSYLVVGGSTRSLAAAGLLGLVYRPGGRRLGVLFVKPSIEALDRLAGLAVNGELEVPIERQFSLVELPEALRRLGTGEATGRLVLNFAGDVAEPPSPL